LRILFWSQEFLPSLGGVEIYTKNLAAGLIRAGHQVRVISGRHGPDQPDHEFIDGVEVFRFPFHRALSKHDLTLIGLIGSSVLACKRDFSADLTHINLTDASPFFYWRHRDPQDRHILVVHYPLDKLANGTGLVSQLSATASANVAISNFMAQHLGEKLGRPPSDFVLIPNGANERVFRAPARTGARDGSTFLFAGRLTKEKGLFVLLDAIAKLVRDGRDVRVKLAGRGPDEENLKRAIDERKLVDNFSLMGKLSQPELAEFFDTGTALVLPSLFQEPAPLIIVEAALCGLPAIASNLGGIPEIIENGISGLLFKPGSADDLANKIALLLDDPTLVERLGNGVRNKAMSSYRIEKMIERYLKLYQFCLL
jgi:glycosyltransferase involved in cell wall biosynthesis